MNKNLDNEIKTVLNKKAEDISSPLNLLNSIKANLEKEKEINTMKKLSNKPRILIAAALITLVLGSVAIASSGLGGIIASSNSRKAIDHYPTVEEINKEVDYTPKYTDNLQGYAFDFAQPSVVEDIDEGGNKSNKHSEISFWYSTPKGILTLNTSPIIRENDKTGEAISYDNITMYYSSYVYMAVPPDYKPTEEELNLEKEGKIMIGYGSDEIEKDDTQSLVWVDNGITYNINAMGVGIDKNTIIEMAKQVIDTK